MCFLKKKTADGLLEEIIRWLKKKKKHPECGEGVMFSDGKGDNSTLMKSLKIVITSVIICWILRTLLWVCHFLVIQEMARSIPKK